MTTPATLACKRLCLFRCLKAIALSLLMQFLLLTIFLLFINFHILHPLQWVRETFGLLFALYTWFTSIPLIVAVILYGIVLGKCHLATQTYYPTRFKWFVGTIFKKFVLLSVHVLMGLLTAWMYTHFLHGDYRSLIFDCYGTKCLNPRYTFLLCVGIAASCYYYCKHHLRTETTVNFPIIQELKLVQIRTQLYGTLYRSLLKSFLPTIAFALVYWLCGSLLNVRLANILRVEVDETSHAFFAIAGNPRLLFYACLLCSQILSNMQLMQAFYSIFLAEEFHFPIERNPLCTLQSSSEVTLVEALAMDHLPVIQQLAAQELYNISLIRNVEKRRPVYALSVPGGHPHNWQKLSEQCLSLISGFTAELSCSVKTISNVKSSPLLFPAPYKLSATEAAQKILLRQYNEAYGIRRMVREPATTSPNALSPSAGQTTTKKPSPASQLIHERFERLARNIEQTARAALRSVPGLLYVFGEPDGAKTAYLLDHSQLILWLTQGLAGICAASLREDNYGVVQVSLAQILKTLLQLKQELDKLNNVNLNGRKLDPNYVALKNVVKRSLYNVCNVFGDYLRDLVDDPQDLRVLCAFANYQDT